jgi:hypothetical protein
VSHIIIITQQGTGPGGSANATVEYTPSHDTAPSEQIKKARRAERVLERLNDYLYNDAAYPLEHED